MIKESNLIFASNLKAERVRRHKTQEQFSKFLGVNRPQYAAWEEGRSTPYMNMMASIAEKLGIKDVPRFMNEPYKREKKPREMSEIEFKYQQLTEEKRAIVDMILNQ